MLVLEVPVFSIVLQMYVSGDTMYGVLSLNNLVQISSHTLVCKGKEQTGKEPSITSKNQALMKMGNAAFQP